MVRNNRMMCKPALTPHPRRAFGLVGVPRVPVLGAGWCPWFGRDWRRAYCSSGQTCVSGLTRPANTA
jgi:hypothetical protein